MPTPDPAGPTDPSVVGELSAGDRAYLTRFSGAIAPTPVDVSALDASTAARTAAEAAAALTIDQVAELLGMDVAVVEEQTTAGELFAHGVGTARRWPDWQFQDARVLPHLQAVLRAIPSGSHPVPVRAFLTGADDALTKDDRPMSPRDWLAAGGDPGIVLELARTLGEQV